MGWAKEAIPQKLFISEPSLKANQMGLFCVGTSSGGHVPISQISPSVRGKKGLARSRVISINTKSEALSTQNPGWRIIDGSKRRPDNNF